MAKISGLWVRRARFATSNSETAHLEFAHLVRGRVRARLNEERKVSMVKSHTRFGKPSWALDALGGGTGEAEQAVDFQFSVTWSSLFAPLPASKAPDAVVPMNHRVPTLVTGSKEPPPQRQETALTKQSVE